MTTENKQTLTLLGPDRVGLFLVDTKLFSNGPLATLSKMFSGRRMTIQTRRLGTRCGHAPLKHAIKALRPVSFRTGAWKPFRMLTGGPAGTASLASRHPLTPHTPSDFDGRNLALGGELPWLGSCAHHFGPMNETPHSESAARL